MTSVTREQAMKILHQITSTHAHEAYFKKAEVVSHDGAFAIDLWVDGEMWRSRPSPGTMPPIVDHVPLHVLMVG